MLEYASTVKSVSVERDRGRKIYSSCSKSYASSQSNGNTIT